MKAWTRVRFLAWFADVESSAGDSLERVLFEGQVEECGEAVVSALVDEALATWESWQSSSQRSSTPAVETQLSIQVFSEDDSIRPALQLSAEQVRRIAAADASVDFDPYVY